MSSKASTSDHMIVCGACAPWATYDATALALALAGGLALVDVLALAGVLALALVSVLVLEDALALALVPLRPAVLAASRTIFASSSAAA